MFADGCGGWCHAVSHDGGVHWNETEPFVLGGIGTGPWTVLPNGTALGLYCAGSVGCKALTCAGFDPMLLNVTNHGMVMRKPAALTGFRDPARPIVMNSRRLCTVIGAGAHDCETGGNKWMLMCVIVCH